MAQRKEVYSIKIIAGSRTYFFDVRETKKGEKYLKITETQLVKGKRRRRPLMIFEDHIQEFSKTFKEIIKQFK